MKNLMKSQSGFSLVELMTVVAIMGTLAAIAIPKFQATADVSKRQQIKADMAVALAAQNSFHLSKKTLVEALRDGGYAGAGCVMCTQGAVGMTDPSTWNIAAGDAAWKIMGYDKNPIDPWGRPYIIDDNQGEFGPDDCRFDTIYSAGPDGIWVGVGNGDQVFGDDVAFRLPRYEGGNWHCTSGNADVGSAPL